MEGRFPLHMHHIAEDCCRLSTKLSVYQHVDVVEIPEEALGEVRRVNAEKARAEPLMPKCHADQIKYATVTKTHFVHAHKLFAEGGRSLYDSGQIRLTLGDSDKEGAQITATGPPLQGLSQRALRGQESAGRAGGR